MMSVKKLRPYKALFTGLTFSGRTDRKGVLARAQTPHIYTTPKFSYFACGPPKYFKSLH